MLLLGGKEKSIRRTSEATHESTIAAWRSKLRKTAGSEQDGAANARGGEETRVHCCPGRWCCLNGTACCPPSRVPSSPGLLDFTQNLLQLEQQPAGNGLLAEELLSGGYRLCREVAVQSWTLSAGANPLTSAEEECAGRRGAEEEACVRALITELAAAAQDSARIRKTFATRSYDAGKDFACKTWRWDAGEGAYSPEVTWTDTWQKICEAHNDDSTRQRHSFPFPDRAFRWMKESEHG
eukprot:3936712-Rhodomonas_salina.2